MTKTQKTTLEKQQEFMDEFVRTFGETKLNDSAKAAGIDLEKFAEQDTQVRFAWVKTLLEEMKENRNKTESQSGGFKKGNNGNFAMPTHKEMLEALHENTEGEEGVELHSEWVNLANPKDLPVFRATLVCKCGKFTAYGVVRLESGEKLDLGTPEGMEKAVKEGDTSAVKRVIFRAFPKYRDAK